MRTISRLSLAIALSPCFLTAAPKGEKVVHGRAAFKREAHQLNIETSEKAIIDWHAFSIGEGERVHFLQPNSKSAVLNRVSGKEMSQLDGVLHSNGKVYLINPHGIVVGPNARIDTASFFASTQDVLDEQFLNQSELLFKGESEGSILNLGTIRAADGDIVLIARKIDNHGTLQAPQGAAALGGGYEILFQPEGQTLLQIAPSLPLAEGVTHAGVIEALRAEIQTTAQIYMMGICRQNKSETALSVVDGKVYLKGKDVAVNGKVESVQIGIDGGTVGLGKEAVLAGSKISLHMSDDKPLFQAGTIDASASEGGEIAITAPKMMFSGTILAQGTKGAGGSVSIHTTGAYIETASGSIQVDGKEAGGRIAIDAGTLFSSGSHSATGGQGGTLHYQGDILSLIAAALDASGGEGGQIEIGKGASAVLIGSHTRIVADSFSCGNGGSVVIDAPGKTEFFGTISACGGPEGGNGGFVEVSGKKELVYGGSTLASAPKGEAGHVLLDPQNITISSSGTYPQYQLIDPHSPSDGSFGARIVPLSTGNIVVTKPDDDFTATGAGAVYLYNGFTAALISTITGSAAADNVGTNITTLTGNGNYVIMSPSWNGTLGAATWGSGTSGVSGTVNVNNSLTGSVAADAVGSSVTALTNGNYVTFTTTWTNAGAGSSGAVTWGNGTSGVTGTVSASNSLVGIQLNDAVGTGVTALDNGNYVVRSSNWNNGAVGTAGAVTWGSGTSGVSGTVSVSNSMVGATATDRVGTAVTQLSNQNYVITSANWNGTAGAATWASGTGVTAGTVSALNSLTGSAPTDGSSMSVTALTGNGHFVVSTPGWSGTIGGATWGSGTSAITGTINVTNSLLGSVAGDGTSLVTTALSNGNYVVARPSWDNPAGAASVGAATWCDGTVGRTGTVTTGNSLIGFLINDNVSSSGVVALTGNGNYVVNSSAWDNGGTANVGASTWCDGSVGRTGTVSSSNSLIGSQGSDAVGNGSAFALSNGNYLVKSTSWADGGVTTAGAVTWANGSTGITGTVSISNSLVGSTSGDASTQSFTELTGNGNFVISATSWDNGASTNAGAATWGSGTSGVTGTISASNSLIGSQSNNNVGTDVFVLTNGNYLVRSPLWDNGGTTNVGAVTWGNGTTGVTGTVSVSNSLIGTTAGDQVGIAALALENGNYVVIATSWDNPAGPFTNAGALTWGSGTSGIAGTVSVANSIVGAASNTSFSSTSVVEETVTGEFLGGFQAENISGIVRVGLSDPSLWAFDRIPSQSMTISPASIASILSSGTPMTLQASNDIVISTAFTGGGADLSLVAGRSALIEANMTLTSGDLSIEANAPASSGVVNAERLAGNAVLSVAPGVSLNVPAGSLTLNLNTGSGNSNSSSADLAIGENATLTSQGAMNLLAQVNSITLGGNSVLQTTSGNLLLQAGTSIKSTASHTIRSGGALTLVVDNLFPSSIGPGFASIPNAILATNGGALWIFTSQQSLNTLPSFINGASFSPGREFANSDQERWGVFYPDGSGGVPFRIFYKSNIPLSVRNSLNSTVNTIFELFNSDPTSATASLIRAFFGSLLPLPLVLDEMDCDMVRMLAPRRTPEDKPLRCKKQKQYD